MSAKVLDSKVVGGAVVDTIEICRCTGEQLERGHTCGQGNCPNSK